MSNYKRKQELRLQIEPERFASEKIKKATPPFGHPPKDGNKKKDKLKKSLSLIFMK
jgi:hypothetical protein